MEKKRGLESHSVGKRFGVHTVDPRAIKFDPEFNVRMDYGDIESLKDSISENGVRVPIRVYIKGDDLFLVDGFRRHRAVMELIQEGVDIKGIPAVCETKNYNEENRILDMFLCNDGKNINMLETGILFNRLIKVGGYNQTEIAQKVGKTPAYVSNCIALTAMGKPLQTLIIEGKAACSTVLTTLRECDNNEELTLAAFEEVAKENENNNNGNGNTPKPATQSAVRRVLDPNRITPAKRLKELKEWLDSHDTNSYNGDEMYRAIKMVYEYVKEGNHSIDCIGELLKSE